MELRSLYVNYLTQCLNNNINFAYLHPVKKIVKEVSKVKEKEKLTEMECKMEGKERKTPKVKIAKDFKRN